MPTYEYACRDCGEHLEVVQSFKDDPLSVCPNCDGELRKVFSAAPIVFKGSGWHIKDYGRSGSVGTGGDEAGGSDTAGSDSAKSDKADSKSGSTSGSKSDSESGSQSGSKSGSKSDDSSSERKSA